MPKKKPPGYVPMTCAEAGRRGGERTRERGRLFYQKIGRMGGAKVRELMQKGKERELEEQG